MGKTHGGSYRSEYGRWKQMRARCSNPNHTQWDDYGGRGIEVCERWQKFENFYADMGDCPFGLTLERKDNDGNYEPSNCVWASRCAQTRNYRRNRWINWRGETRCLSDWNNHFGLGPNVLAGRLRRRSVNDVFSQLDP